MKLVILLVLSALRCGAQEYLVPVPSKQSIRFQIKNFGLTTEGSFEHMDGKIVWDGSDVSNCSFDISINAASVSTGIALRDKHLQKEDYFEAAKFPEIRFKSSKIISTKEPGNFEVQGTLTIKETSKAISFNFIHSVENGNHVFKGQLSLNRRDYGVGNRSLSLSDVVIVLLNVSTVKRDGSN